MEAELRTYRDQLAYVNLSLEAKPDDESLLKLKEELLDIIQLTQAALDAQAGSSKSVDPSKSKGKSRDVNWQDQGPYKAGMDCMAKYKDGKWYPAKISAVVGSQDSPLYTITFKGYSSSTNVPVTSLRPHDPSAPVPTQKRGAEELSEKEKEKKKLKGEKWMASQKARAEEVKEKKNAWEKFGKKAQKKGIHIAGLEGKSVFRTADNPFGRVGVVGSGKGITEYERMGKHKFDRESED
ncbi:hypothetical protein M231_01671 [Tremella mesenterica]|uniref:Tudor domain-containing protein n=1 Tax=Tremella mesenterica TaxID=5217 RepID=A0A4Q1BSV2_TREME|nr:uncharacterized protein TREMEDRAFT_72598 [Tremella mesenterica DSM 1558]EIW65452.1 hypothetical protein TREMEDRAFT_72598 [Tremella mesenterica DSM 1558]RXK41040.1 hypothetical protein M231_01671 [Tremella mesenterica]